MIAPVLTFDDLAEDTGSQCPTISAVEYVLSEK